MKCPKCQAENSDKAKFCISCGKSFQTEIECPQCRHPNKTVAKFCEECGQSLTQSVEQPPFSPPPATPPPTTFASGRYEIKEFLGEGGKKKVYKAYDTLLDREVALALIKSEGLDKESMARITREAQAMGRLGAHPNIVTVFDLGKDQDQPYIVTELMGGGDVESLIAKAENHRLPMDQTLEIAESVGRGLEFAHGKGVIHRDLKPGNVWITEEGMVKIGDFGLALVEDRTRLTGQGLMLGTVSYMAPEQAVGGEITPQSDLYSLGAMLYEMTTGRPPFIGDDPVAIIGQHMNTQPVSPSWHNKEISPGLETLILRLLEKDAQNRPSSASEVLRSLDLISRGVEGEEILPEPSTRDTRTPVYRQIFVGREAELKQLKTAFDKALSGHGSLIMVVGEPGIGKTALTQQLATYVSMRGGSTLVGHCYEEGSLSLPYLAFVEAMRTYVLNRDEADLRRDMGSGASEVARIVSEVRDKLHVEPRPPTNPDEDRYRLFQAVTDFLSHASEVEPLLIVLEDLHDADKGTLDLLTYITHRLDKGRFLLVGSYRDIEVDRSHPLASTLAELRRVSTYERILLRGLTIDEVQRMLSGLSGQVVQWQIAEAVHRQTEGNPLFVQEVLRYAVEGGLIIRESGEWRAVDPDRLLMSIPEGLRDVIGKRLSHLSPECGQVLSMASVMGREFRFEVIQRLSNLSDETLFAALQEAINAAVIEERTPSAAAVRYRFTHAFIRQALYEEMVAPRRNQLHIRIAKTLEELFTTRLPDHAVELAEHFSHSTYPEDLSKAVHFGRMAAERATSVFDYGEAVRLLQQTLQFQEVLDPDNKTKKVELLLDLSEALVNAGEPRQALDSELPAAFALAESAEAEEIAWRACQLAMLALVYWQGGTFFVWASEEGRQWIERSDQYAKPNTSERAMTDFYLGLVTYSTGLATGSFDSLKTGSLVMSQAIEQLRKLGDNEILWLIIPLWLVYGSTPQGFGEQLKIAEEMSQRTRQGIRLERGISQLFVVGNTFLEYGQRQRCEDLWNECHVIFERTRQGNGLIYSLAIRGVLSTMDGRLDEAVAETNVLLSKAAELDLQTFARHHWEFSGMRANYLLGNIQRLFDSLPPPPEVTYLRTLYLAALNKQDEVKDLLDKLLKRRPNIGTEDDYLWCFLDVVYLEAAVLVGHHRAAEALLRQLAGKMPNITGFYYPTCVPRHLGSAAAMLGRPEEARNYYQEAMRAASNVRFRPEIALTRFQLAELLLEHFPQEKTEAKAHLDFALEEFNEMKMQPSLEKAEKLKAKYGL
jgi:serine/threonine protein kinase/tetratricopeptide (TPR) repeat protein